MDTRDALTFILSEIDRQAERDRVTLTYEERRILRWSEIEPDGVRDRALIDRFESTNSYAEFRKKIAKIVRRARKRAKGNAEIVAKWDECLQCLEDHDYHLLNVIIADSRRGLSRFWSAR